MRLGSIWIFFYCVFLTLTLHAEGTVSVSPDGRWVAAENGQSMHLWERSTGRRLRRWIIPNIHRVRFSVDGKELLVVQGKYTILRVDPSSGKFLENFNVSEVDGIVDVNFDPRSSTLRAIVQSNSGHGNFLRVYDLKSNDPLQVQELKHFHDGRVTGMVTDPKGNWIITSGDDGTLRRWEVKRERLLQTLQAGFIQDIDVSQDGLRVAACMGIDSKVKVRIWELSTGRSGQDFPLEDMGESGATLTAAGPTLWTWNEGRLQGKNLTTRKSHLYSMNEDGVGSTIRNWDRVLHQKKHGPLCDALAFYPDGQKLICGNSGGATILDAKTGDGLGHWSGAPGEFYVLALSPNGKELLSGTQVGSAKLWILEPFPPQVALRLEVKSSPLERIYSKGSERATSVAFSPTGDRFAVAFTDGTLRIHDTKTRKNLHTLSLTSWVDRWLRTLPGPTHLEMLSLAFSPDGKMLASGDQSGRVTLWDLSKGKVWSQWKENVGNLVYSPNGAILAASSFEGVRLRDLHTGQVIAELDGGGPLVFDRNGTWLATGGAGGCIRFWNLPQGKLIRTLFGHEAPVNSLALSPDGTTLLSGSEYSIRSWNLRAMPNASEPDLIAKVPRMEWRSLSYIVGH